MKTENNKIIAEFMGAYQDDKGYWGFTNTKERHRWHTDRFLDATYYDTDWNWLMGVVGKIEEMADWSLELLTTDKKEYQMLIPLSNTNIIVEMKIEAVYKACVEFIKWYNENGAKNN